MGEAKRKTYAAAFKAKVALEAIRGVKTVNEIGQEHAGTLFETKRGRKPADDQSAPERLYSEIGRLKMELDWLKKSPG
ncbi:transposase IS3/IS911 family protein [Thiorhodococcus drewsii AZ1]|uniref:Transposase IS3/IS911 family protein n=1 Tax=Thiorhodococcus drewsii AZ1 TaxID=765913 RepID=G2E8L8_9GAMM|nr:transposase IS3/IS911 family protein [Thiorhodococcus drewsii AZ1]